MVTLKQTGFECEYEMGVFMRLYFKKDQNARVSTVFSEDDLSAVCTIEYDGKIFEEKVGIDIKPFYDGDVIRKAYKNAVVESFCRAAGHIRSIPRPWGVMSGIRPAKNMRLLCEKFDREQTDSIFGDIYYVTEEKRRLAYEVCKNEADIVNSHDERSAGIYIGIPFCPTRCSYCSFISSPIKVSGRYIPEYVSLLTEEIKKTGEIMRKAGIYAESIYMGGGTPTALNADMLDDIFGALERYIDMTGVKEMTLEAGRPDTIDEEKLVTALRHGVNRISINPQTMHRTTLERIGRRHTPEDIEESFALARRCGFDCINTDLIAGLPGESFEMFRESLDMVCALGSENLTVHTMCVKRAADISDDDVDITHADHVNKMLGYAHEKTNSLGYVPYYMYRQKNIIGNLENVGYSKKGHEGIYNVKIMEEVQNIIALGGGGVSKIIKGDRIERVFNFKDASEYIGRFDEIIKRKDKVLSLLLG